MDFKECCSLGSGVNLSDRLIQRQRLVLIFHLPKQQIRARMFTKHQHPRAGCRAGELLLPLASRSCRPDPASPQGLLSFRGNKESGRFARPQPTSLEKSLQVVCPFLGVQKETERNQQNEEINGFSLIFPHIQPASKRTSSEPLFPGRYGNVSLFSPLLKELFLICHVMKLVLAEILSWKSQAAWGDAIVLPTARRASRTR